VALRAVDEATESSLELVEPGLQEGDLGGQQGDLGLGGQGSVGNGTVLTPDVR
jgi:hypothetical protein